MPRALRPAGNRRLEASIKKSEKELMPKYPAIHDIAFTA
jgi:hypothetical protein